MATTPLDLDAIRARFPGLQRAGPNGRPFVFLDGPGGSQVPLEVIAAISGYLEHSNANLGGPFATSVESVDLLDRTKEAVADFLGCTTDEVVYGPNMTTLNFLLAHAAARTFAPGDEVIVTVLDHDANVGPWYKVAEDHGLVIRTLEGRDGDLQLEPERLRAMLTPRTRVVAFTLASNGIGTKPDARALADVAHEAGALVWNDAVHYAPHHLIDVHELGADVLLCSPYKFFGPHQGVAYVRKDLAETLPADKVRPAAEWPPGHRFETGTQNHEAIAGVGAAIEYLASLGEGATRRERLASAYERIVAHEEALSRRMLDGLAEVPGLTLYGVSDPASIKERTPTYTFRLAGRTPREVCEALADEGICGWDGNYYALNAMVALGLEGSGGAVRLGFLHYTTEDEVERTLDALNRIARG